MPVSPPNQPGSLVTFQILSGGSLLPDSIAVTSVTIEKRLNRPFSAQFVLLDGDAATGEFGISSSGLFVPGSTININAGYNGQNSLLFEGKVMSQNISIKGVAASMLTVDCRSTSIESWTINSNPVITVQYGVDILEFNAEYSRSTTTGIAKVHGVVTFQGSALAKPGEYISLAGLGSRFNGNHLISAVVHRIEGGNWITEVAFGLAD